ncbi:bifunctional glutamate N-acetyltransferase/amino-acid acetyltransferase ArgJ [cyanobiont of Ornithocercus magnificus]|nr:bifunctional glutamate N-acetyltransferase/amino-acid acetyltransferase ArgJ [cyanobiont of Ornithocercus magnificus]
MPAASSVTWSTISGGLTAPRGFLAAGVTAGLKDSGRPDLALLLAPEEAVCAGLFTCSVVRASCIELCTSRLQSTSGHARAVLVNSGQANACTGSRGLVDSELATSALASRLGLATDAVLICSTGLIGVPIPMQRLLASLDSLVEQLDPEGGVYASEAILTTDLVQKQAAFEAQIGGRNVRIGGMAKGSGMIHPEMATMLAFINCDVAVPVKIWQKMLARAVSQSFNAITVDGDTSTNDSVLAFAAGDQLPEHYFADLEYGLTLVTQQLARAIARDGEGATCLIEVQVEGTNCDVDARHIARTICGSSLVKAAIHGRDPNWGRIVAAAGRSGVAFNPNSVDLWIESHQLMRSGSPLLFDRRAASHDLHDRSIGGLYANEPVIIRLSIGNGPGVGRAWGCDLSEQYVHINAGYTT